MKVVYVKSWFCDPLPIEPDVLVRFVDFKGDIVQEYYIDTDLNHHFGCNGLYATFN